MIIGRCASKAFRFDTTSSLHLVKTPKDMEKTILEHKPKIAMRAIGPVFEDTIDATNHASCPCPLSMLEAAQCRISNQPTTYNSKETRLFKMTAERIIDILINQTGLIA